MAIHPSFCSTRVPGGKAPTVQQHTHNRCRSRIRAHVEHVFGHQVTAMGGKLIRTVWLVQASLKIGRKNLTYNFQRLGVLSAPWKPQEA
ncbi:MAG: hypothetical protein OEZ41_00955 [Nitrospirota bacterium]|nr:hypothetical protein [Nitrospirota bacterium]MDH5698516.1 hypothetical protein [Nitrospirota bacterium]